MSDIPPAPAKSPILIIVLLAVVVARAGGRLVHRGSLVAPHTAKPPRRCASLGSHPRTWPRSSALLKTPGVEVVERTKTKGSGGGCKNRCPREPSWRP